MKIKNQLTYNSARLQQPVPKIGKGFMVYRL